MGRISLGVSERWLTGEICILVTSGLPWPNLLIKEEFIPSSSYLTACWSSQQYRRFALERHALNLRRSRKEETAKFLYAHYVFTSVCDSDTNLKGYSRNTYLGSRSICRRGLSSSQRHTQDVKGLKTDSDGFTLAKGISNATFVISRMVCMFADFPDLVCLSFGNIGVSC